MIRLEELLELPCPDAAGLTEDAGFTRLRIRPWARVTAGFSWPTENGRQESIARP